MNVCVIGTGYVGLTTGLCLAYVGHEVYCVDVDSSKIDRLRKGMPTIHEPGLLELLLAVRKRLHFTTCISEGLEQAQVVFIAVGTPSAPDGSPDLQYVREASKQIGEHLNGHFTVVVNKSTVPVGAGNWVESIIFDCYRERHGREPEGGFVVASNPEFLREGSAILDSLYPDRIVIGVDDPRGMHTLLDLYRPILDQNFVCPAFAPRPEGCSTVPLVTTDLTSAELIKYAANAFLSTKISFANEIGYLAERVGANVKQVMQGIGFDARIGHRFLQAGLGWGGSCFGKDTAALVATAREYGACMRIVQAARDVNYNQRTLIVDKLLGALKILKGKTIGILGLAFKPNTDDLRDSPGLDIAQRLLGRGAKVRAHDPIALVNAQALEATADVVLCPDPKSLFEGADAVLLATDWPEYSKLPWDELGSLMRARIVLDGRNFLDRTMLIEKGFHYIGMGV
jgi:UDPglucose 6-dehydrogenase